MKLLDNNPSRDPIKALRFNDLKTYFVSNKIGIENQNIEGNIGCSIENTISHHVKWLLGYGSKAFSKDTYYKIINIHMAQVNGIDIIELFKNQVVKTVVQTQQFFRRSIWINNKKCYDNKYEIANQSDSRLNKTLRNYSNIFNFNNKKI